MFCCCLDLPRPADPGCIHVRSPSWLQPRPCGGILRSSLSRRSTDLHVSILVVFFSLNRSIDRLHALSLSLDNNNLCSLWIDCIVIVNLPRSRPDLVHRAALAWLCRRPGSCSRGGRGAGRLPACRSSPSRKQKRDRARSHATQAWVAASARAQPAGRRRHRGGGACVADGHLTS
jgi:hypothetical protein